jgi:DNA (cytosine-5)-methyltransferase 1
MNELHLFAGAGGGILGGMLLGHTTVCAVELELYCRNVLLQRQRDGILPRFPIWDDVCTFDGNPWRGKVDVVCGGFPCQDISAAGKGAGITGERSGLWGEMARIIGEIRPKYAFVENSPMLTLRGLDRVLGDLSEMGYDARWGVVGACHVGAPHRRERIWILAYPISTRHKNRLCIGKEKGHTTHGNRNKNSAWTSDSIKPCSSSLVDRNVDGVAHRVDRLKAIGNGQVPLVAATAWRILGGE